MIAEIFLNTVFLPLIFGVVFYVAAMFFKDQNTLITLIAGLLSFAIYILLEGFPTLPPISSKHKVAIIISGFVVATLILGQLKLNRFGISSVLLIGALIWLGWNRLSDPAMLPRFGALLAIIFIATFSTAKFDWQPKSGLVWPITLLCFAIGGSLISLLGAYIGFAQALGAMAAFMGGYILVTYVSILLWPDKPSILFSQSVNQIVLLTMMTLLLVVGLFAPDASPAALTVLGLTLLVPLFNSRFDGANRLLKPILFGVTAAIPAAASIAIATL